MVSGMMSMVSMVRALGRFQRRSSLFMGAAAFVAVGMMCGGFPVLKEAPASAVTLDIRLSYNEAPPGKVDLVIFFGSVRLPEGVQITCDGVDVMQNKIRAPKQSAVGLINRQPPGGAYTCVYTDEKGKQTTFSIPEPTGQLAVTSPRAGAKVPIPWRSQPPWYLETPAATPVPPILHNPFSIAYTLPDIPGDQPAASISARVEKCSSATNDANDATCGTVAEGKDEYVAQNGTLLLSDDFLPGPGAYDYLSPGPGKVRLFMSTGSWLAPQGFRSIYLRLDEDATTTFTWIAAN